jgi:hypothetical protein
MADWVGVDHAPAPTLLSEEPRAELVFARIDLVSADGAEGSYWLLSLVPP